MKEKDGYVMGANLYLGINENLDIHITEEPVDHLCNAIGKLRVDVIRTKEAMFRDALIFLGWTPPVKEKTLEELEASGILERKYESGT